MEQLSEEWFYSQGYLKNKQGCWYKDPNSYSTNPINQSQQYPNQAQRKQSEDKAALIAELVEALKKISKGRIKTYHTDKNYGEINGELVLINSVDVEDSSRPTGDAKIAIDALSAAAKMGYGKE